MARWFVTAASRSPALLLIALVVIGLAMLGQATAPPAARAHGEVHGEANPADTHKPVPAEIAYFLFDYPPAPETFVFQLADAVKIERARSILQGDLSTPHVLGRIVKEPAPYNRPWGYHLDPDSVDFFYSAIEVCDATITYVEAHIDEVCGTLLPNCDWCPWGSRLLAEVTIPPWHTVHLPLILK